MIFSLSTNTIFTSQVLKVKKMSSWWNKSMDDPESHLGLTQFYLTFKENLYMISNYKVDIPIRPSTPSHVILPSTSLCFYSIPQATFKD